MLNQHRRPSLFATTLLLAISASCGETLAHPPQSAATQTRSQGTQVSPTAPKEVEASPYARWSNGPPAREDFFPIAVWLQDPNNAGRYEAIGINLFIGLWKGPTAKQLDVLRGQDMDAIAAQNALALTHPNNSVLRAWAHGDEPDNAQWNGKSYDPPITPAEIVKRYKAMQAKDSSRPVFLNLGQGVAYDNWVGRGVRTNHPEDYPKYMEGADIVSFDIYPVTSRHAEVTGKLEFVAKGVERLVKWSNGRKIVWNVIETTHINSTVMPTPDQVRSEVWMSLIHGSMGICYFAHEFKPKFIEAGIFAYPRMKAGVAAINKRITSLAPVLNSRTLAGVATVTSTNSNAPIRMMVKRHRGETYVFAVCMRKLDTTGKFVVSGLPSSAKATVLDENRTITVSGGKFEDKFGPYAVHLYRIR